MSITPCLAKLSPCLAVITPCLAVISRDFSRARARALTVRFLGSLSQKILKNAGLSRDFY